MLAGVCPVADFSQTLICRVGPAAASAFYLTNRVLSAAEALDVQLTHEVQPGISATQQRARQVASLRVHVPQLDPAADVMLAREALGHAECRVFHLNYAQPGVGSPAEIAIDIDWHTPRDSPVSEDGGCVCVLGSIGEGCVPCDSAGPLLLSMGAMREARAVGSTPSVVVCVGQRCSISFLGDAVAVLAHPDATLVLGEMSHVAGVAALRRLGHGACEDLAVTGAALDDTKARRQGAVDMVGVSEELSAEADRLRLVLERVGSSMCARGSTADEAFSPHPAGEPPRASTLTSTVGAQLRVGLDASCRLGVIRVETGWGAGIASGLADAVENLLALGPSVRAIAINLVGGKGTPFPRPSERSNSRLRRCLAAVRSLAVPVVCSCSGEVSALSLAVSLAADYRIIDQRAVYFSGDASARRVGVVEAQRKGWVSQVVHLPDQVEEQAWRFAAWLAHQPAIGLKHMLGLTRSPGRSPTQVARSASRGATRQLALLAVSSCPETRLELQRCVHPPESANDPTPRPPLEANGARLAFAALTSQRPLPLASLDAAATRALSAPPTSGIHAIEVYVPAYCVTAASLRAHGGEGEFLHNELVER